MSAEQQNRQRFVLMVELGINIAKVFFTTVIYPTIVATWKTSNPSPDRIDPPDVWDRSTREACGEWLLDPYARNIPDIMNVRYRRGDLFARNNLFGGIVKAEQLRDIRIGDVFADSGHGWDLTLLWLVITNFFCDPEVRKKRGKEEYIRIQELFLFKEFRNSCWGHHGSAAEMCNAEFIKFCQTDPPTGIVVRLVHGLMRMTLREAIRLGKEREACMGMLKYAFSFETRAKEKAGEIVREANPSQKEAKIWMYILEKMNRIYTQVTETTVHTNQPIVLTTHEPGCRLELKLSTWNATKGQYLEQLASYPIRDRFMDSFYAGTELTGLPRHVSGWSAGEEFSGRSASRRHCALAEFDTEAESCFVTNVSLTSPLLIGQDEGPVVELKGGDYRAVVVNGLGSVPCRRFLLHVVRGEIPAVEITDLDGDSGTRPQRYGDGDLVINREYFLVPTDKGISVFPRPPAGAEICAKIFISMVGVSVSDHNRCLFEYVPPSHRRLLEKGSIVRLGTEIMLEVVTIRELNGSEKEEVESSFSTCGGK